MNIFQSYSILSSLKMFGNIVVATLWYLTLDDDDIVSNILTQYLRIQILWLTSSSPSNKLPVYSMKASILNKIQGKGMCFK